MPFHQLFSQFHHSSYSTSAEILRNSIEYIEGVLYLATLGTAPQQTADTHFFSIDNELVYINFFADFGPNNLAHVIQFIEILGEKFQSPNTRNKKICLYSSHEPAKRANAAFLISAYMMIALKQTPEEACRPLMPHLDSITPYRDAGYGPDTYHISILDCLKGLYKAMTLGLVDIDTIIAEEYRFYEKVENGDLNWLCGKFLALASPHDDLPAGMAEYTAKEHWIEYDERREGATGAAGEAFSFTAKIARATGLAKGGDSQAQRTGDLMDIDEPDDESTNVAGAATGKVRCRKMLRSVFCIPNLIQYLREHDVRALVRLNNKLYERNQFLDAGIDHVEMYFPDGTTPPETIMKRFLDLCEATEGAIAVHCKAGLGRTGTLIAAYMMKHYRFTASEVIGYLRVMRPGSVVGPQQNFLLSIQQKMWRLHPPVRLPTSVSLLKPPTFYTSTRFQHTVPEALRRASVARDLTAHRRPLFATTGAAPALHVSRSRDEDELAEIIRGSEVGAAVVSSPAALLSTTLKATDIAAALPRSFSQYTAGWNNREVAAAGAIPKQPRKMRVERDAVIESLLTQETKEEHGLQPRNAFAAPAADAQQQRTIGYNLRSSTAASASADAAPSADGLTSIRGFERPAGVIRTARSAQQQRPGSSAKSGVAPSASADFVVTGRSANYSGGKK